MRCTPFLGGFICTRGRRETCSTPGCSRPSVALCDYPLAGPKAGKTCDRKLCAQCRRVQGPNVDYCQPHHDQAKAAKPPAPAAKIRVRVFESREVADDPTTERFRVEVDGRVVARFVQRHEATSRASREAKRLELEAAT